MAKEQRSFDAILAEYTEVRNSLMRSASGDGIMYLQELERELAAAYLADHDSLIGLECKFVRNGQADHITLDVVQGALPLIGDSIQAQRGPIGVVASRRNFVYNISGHFIRLFWEQDNA